MDRIEDIEIFAEVAEQASFSSAARRLNRSPTAVTRAVAELEARLGVRLLNRTTRAVSLTDAGARFLGGAKRVLADLTEIEQAAAGQGAAPRGELAITAPILFGRLHVLPVLFKFFAEFPDVTARCLLIDRPVDLVEERIDAAIRIGALPDSSAVATRLGSLRRLVIASPDYLKWRGVPLRPTDLAAHDIVAVGGAGTGRWQFGEDAVRLSPRLAVNTAEAAVDAVVAGLGVTRLFSYQAVGALAAGSVVQVLHDYGRDDIPVHLLYPSGAHPPPKLRAFIDFAVPRWRASLDEIEEKLDA